ncbi:hypothetical protein ACFFX0_01725 [Citricoccus parietis]|uniref:Uncharacterized protein n=1 Tax=Citricoccus parietis TaxID=592307 RepID=A0ABV5FTG5_9MICC
MRCTAHLTGRRRPCGFPTMHPCHARHDAPSGALCSSACPTRAAPHRRARSPRSPCAGCGPIWAYSTPRPSSVWTPRCRGTGS